MVQKSKKEQFKQQLIGGMADKKKPSDFEAKALEQGQKVEMEHTEDPEKAKEIAMDHLVEDKDYYQKLKTIEKAGDTCNTSMKKSFIERLLKGGPGSGKKGHNTPRKPYPGEEAYKQTPGEVYKPSYKPPEGLALHYTDYVNGPESGQLTPLGKYKKLIQGFKRQGLDFDGHITFDPKTKEIHLLTDKAKETVKQLLSPKKGNKSDEKPTKKT